jgi:hypothetical protein
MRSRISVRFAVFASLFLCAVAACTGDDEIYAVPKDAGPMPDGPVGSSGGSSTSSSSSGGSAGPDGSTTNDGGGDGSVKSDGGDGGTTDSGAGGDGGVDSGPVVCTTVACVADVTCTAVGCGTCNMGLGFCKP